MVNYGISRACETCRKRRKKCDERRPSCKRCVQAGQICLGYKDETELVFRNYGTQKGTPSASNADPVTPATTIPPWNPLLADFIRDFVVEPVNHDISRGFLNSLPSLLSGASPASDLSRAAALVELAVSRNRQTFAVSNDRTVQEYCDLLQSFQINFSSINDQSTTQTLATAVLLGLYEIVASSESAFCQHNAHVRGVCAILASEPSPFDMRACLQLFQLANPLAVKSHVMSIPGVLSPPTVHSTVLSLDAILARCNPLFSRADALLSNQPFEDAVLEQLHYDATILDAKFSEWSMAQSEDWEPREAGQLVASDLVSQYDQFWLPGKIETYPDLYVAAVWNTYRKTHLMLLDIMSQCSRRIYGDTISMTYRQRADKLIADIVASIPYHITPDLDYFLQHVEEASVTTTYGRPVGGLLLLHPIYVGSVCSIVSDTMQQYFRRCLRLIGQNMGIGQADLLSKTTFNPANSLDAALFPYLQPILHLPFQQMAEGHILIWAGMLL